MMKKLHIAFVFVVLLFLAVGCVSADDGNMTDSILETPENEPVIAINEYSNDNLNNNEEILKSEEINTNLSTSVDVTLNSQQSDDKLGASTGKSNLKVINNTNFVKKGDTLYLYLTDMNGKAVASKKLTIDLKGTTYQKTTDSEGKFGILVNLPESESSMKISYGGDADYNAFSQIIKFYIDKSMSMTIGNTKLLTNGFLRIYLKGSAAAIAGKTVKIQIGNKVFTKKTTDEGFVVIKPKLSKGTYTVTLTYGNYTVSKKIKCIAGDVVNPFKKAIAMVNGVPDIDRMPSNYVMGNNDAKYTVLKDQYKEVLKRDSYCLFLYGKLSKYTFFKTKSSPKIYHILKREKWNVIEQALNIKLVKKNKYNYWPSYVSASLKGKSYTYSEVRDVQNTEYTCGPTSASSCSQALRNYYSEKYFQTKAHVTHGVNLNVLKRAVDNSNFKSTYFYSMSTAVKELAKGGCAVIAYLPNHYVSVLDVSKDGKKILVSNSYGKYNVGGDTRIPTGWVSLTKFNKKFQGAGIIVKPNYKISKTTKTKMNCFYKSMGMKYARQNTNERIPDVPI